MNLPTEEQCLEYFEQYKVPKNILGHCLKVKEIAVFLAQKLKEAGVDVNVELVGRIALLHDLFKIVTVDDLSKSAKQFNYEHTEEEIAMWEELRKKYLGLHECEIAFIVFKDEFPELALAVRNASNPFKEDKSLEEDITHYADWRVANNEIVSLRGRVSELKLRYVRGEEYWDYRFELLWEKEKKIFSHLNFTPEKLRDEIV